MQKDEFIDLVAKKLANSLTRAEEEKYNDLVTDKKFLNEYEKYAVLMKASRREIRLKDKDKSYERLMSKIVSSSGQTLPHRYKFYRLWNSLAVRVAAILVFFLVASFVGVWLLDKPDTIQVAETITITKHTSKGQKSTFFLPDGSKVILNSASVLSFPSEFISDRREVELTGEAFFEFESNPEKPFIVQAGPVEVKALGTSFNVNNVPDADNVKVSLALGKVEVRSMDLYGNKSEPATLLPGQRVIYSTSKKSLLNIENFNKDAEIGWKDGLIYFERASLQDVITKLSDWYDVEIHIKGSVESNWNYNGKFENYTLNNLLYAMSYTEEFDFRIDGKNVFIQF